MTDAGLRALVSLHDVMPETREAVTGLLARMAGIAPERIVLLVVPGRDWGREDLDWLHDLQARGYRLAGHGWHHRCGPPRTFYHRLHSLLLSRDVAEHLSLDAAGIQQLIRDNRAWFVEQGLEPPALYVPPAWALGAIGREELRALPFRYYETLTGLYDARADRFLRLPLIGFEADTAGRAAVLRLCNRLNLFLARRLGRPVRLGVHPHDRDYRLAGDLDQCLRAVREPLLPADL